MARLSSPVPPSGKRLLSAALALILFDASVHANDVAAVHAPEGTPIVLPVGNCADDGGPNTLRAVMTSAPDGAVVDLSALSCSTITLLSGAIEPQALGLTVQGPGADRLTIDGNHNGRVFSLQGGGTIAGLTITNGYVTGDYAVGGCVSAFNALTVSASRITGCTAKATGVAKGGGIWTEYPLSLVDSVVSGNQAIGATGAQGGGVASSYGGVSTLRSTISGNEASASAGTSSAGGGVFAGGVANINYSLVDANAANLGAGVYTATAFLAQGFLFMKNSTISGNTAGDRGGGVATFRAELHIDNSTIAFNRSLARTGSGIYLQDPSSYAALNSSIVAMNTYSDSSIESDIATSEPVFTLSGASNLVRTSTATLPPDTLFTDPLLAPLADNGGATFTHALLPGSPAVDAGSNVADLEFDQRGTGYPRQMGHATDIGAFEVYADPIFADGFEQREGRSGSF
jgi:hypothetical protein